VTLPRTIDSALTPRVSTTTAGKYLGRSGRWVEQQIRTGRIPAIDTSRPGSSRPCWSIAVADLRAFVMECELQARRRLNGESEPAGKERNGRTSEPDPLLNASRRGHRSGNE